MPGLTKQDLQALENSLHTLRTFCQMNSPHCEMCSFRFKFKDGTKQCLLMQAPTAYMIEKIMNAVQKELEMWNTKIKEPLSDASLHNNIDHPSHYNANGIECIDAMRITQGVEAVKDFCICNAFKYLWRYRRKNGIEDVKKAIWYLNKYVELAEVQEVKGGLSEELRKTKELLENRECYIRDLEHELGYDKRIEEE